MSLHRFRGPVAAAFAAIVSAGNALAGDALTPGWMDRIATGRWTQVRAEVDRAFAAGEPAVSEVVRAVRPPGDPAEAAPRMALHALALAAAAPDAGPRRALFARAVAGGLAATDDPEIHRILLGALQISGTTDAVPAIAACLADPAVASAACAALESLSDPAADAAMIAALRTGSPATVGLLFALGRRRAAAAADLALARARDANDAVRRAALTALAELGEPRATALFHSTHAPVSLAILHARRLAERSGKHEALAALEAICASDRPAHERLAAATATFELGAPARLRDMAAGIGAEGRGALRVLVAFPTEREHVRRMYAAGPVELREAILRALADHPGPDTADLIEPALADTNAAVLIAAAALVDRLEPSRRAVGSVEALGRADDATAARNLTAALGRTPTDAVLAAVTRVWPTASARLRSHLIRALAGHRGGAVRRMLLEAVRSDTNEKTASPP